MKILFLTLFLFYTLQAQENTFVDMKTHLEWQDTKDTQDKEQIWKMSKKYCQSLHVKDHDDWRLPTLKELTTLISATQNKKLQYSSTSEYWTINDYEEDDTNAWEIYMGTGHQFYNDKCETAHVRCVRSLPH